MTEIVVMGRLSADIYPTTLRTPLREQRNFTRYVGGFAGNVSTGLARLRVATAIVSKIGNDGHGEFIRDFLSREGVDVRWLGIDHSLNTPVVFCEIWPPDRFPLLFYRTPTCPDWELTTDDFDLNAVAEDTLALFGRPLAKIGVTVDKRLGQIPPIKGSADQFRQLLSNLVVNARDSMSDGGKLIIRTKEIRSSTGLHSWLSLIVGDTGTGIPADLQKSMFEPFVTTKGEKGTGLGLWIVKGVVENHNGRIKVRSTVGKGTVIRLLFPVSR